MSEPTELKLSAIFGTFGLLSNPSLIRDLRRVDLTIPIKSNYEDHVALHRVRIEHFVQMIKQHAVDNNQKPLLRSLQVRLLGTFGFDTPVKGDRFEEFMFNLERFAELTQIPTVKFSGIPKWFAQCLTLRVCGEGGDLSALDWPTGGKDAS